MRLRPEWQLRRLVSRYMLKSLSTVTGSMILRSRGPTIGNEFFLAGSKSRGSQQTQPKRTESSSSTQATYRLESRLPICCPAFIRRHSDYQRNRHEMSPLLRETERPTKSQAARKFTKSSHDKHHGEVNCFIFTPSRWVA